MPATFSQTIKDFFNRPFPLLDSYRNRIFLVVFCGAFASFFIYYFNPFNINRMVYPEAIANFLPIWTAGIWGALVVAITQLLIRKLVGWNTQTVGKFLLWGSFEFILITSGMFIIFGEYSQPFVSEYLLVMRYTVSLTSLPYVLGVLVIAVIHLSLQVKQIPEDGPKPMLFREESGKVVLAVKPENILYLKSENNYTSVVYLENEQIASKLVRTNLKKLESEISYPDLLRIHRSYMVNLNHISSVHRIKGGFNIQLENTPELWLKVSDSYRESFEESIHSPIQSCPIHTK